ncbi:hypothetical protein EV421DRAFT_1848520, partial [Armillaria borealis]
SKAPPCPPVLVGEDNPPFEGMFEFPGTGTREEEKGSQTTPFKVHQPSLCLLSHLTGISQVILHSSSRVLQCGADSLSADKLGCFNPTMFSTYTRKMYLSVETLCGH